MRQAARLEHASELLKRSHWIANVDDGVAGEAERVVAFNNKRGTCEQWIKEGKGAIKWTRLSCRTFAANAVRLQLHALAYNLGNFLRTGTPEPIKDWSLTTLEGQADQDRREGGEAWPLCYLPDGRGRHRTADVARDFAAHRGATATTSASVRRSMSRIQEQPTEGVRPNVRENGQIRPSTKRSGYPRCW